MLTTIIKIYRLVKYFNDVIRDRFLLVLLKGDSIVWFSKQLFDFVPEHNLSLRRVRTTCTFKINRYLQFNTYKFLIVGCYAEKVLSYKALLLLSQSTIFSITYCIYKYIFYTYIQYVPKLVNLLPFMLKDRREGKQDRRNISLRSFGRKDKLM